jgi:hypothetical protein
MYINPLHGKKERGDIDEYSESREEDERNL